MQRISKLSTLGISKLLQADADDENIIVQVFDISTTKSGKITCLVSDGEFFTRAILTQDFSLKPGADEFSIVCIKSHGNLNTNIGVTNLKLVARYPEKLGTPSDWASSKENGKQIKSTRQFSFQKLIKTETKIEQKKMLVETAAKPATGKDSQYQSIDDLHIGLTRWTILCRITSKTFKQSSKKGTKILEIDLVDKSKKKITGTFFNEAAIEFNSFLQQGSIYEISKGRLTEGNYNNSKNEKLSPYTIIFDLNSKFNEVSDVNIIVKSEDSAVTLGSVYQKRTLNQEFDVVAYVVAVKEETSFQKDDKTITLKEVVLADPEARITMNANLWRWKQQFGNEMVGKVLIFSRFMLKQYKGSISLYSGMRSSIISHHGHPMKNYENKQVDVSGFTITTETREKIETDTTDFCWSTQELNEKINRMGQGETIKSILNVWINRFAFLKKWNYEACPKCKKAAEKYSKCQNCEYAIEETNLNFSMGIEIADYCGSIWITAYDELAKKIFYDMGNNAARQLQGLSKEELSEMLENYQYQAFRLKVLTKKDEEGRIRHTAGKLLDLHEERVARENLKKIKLLLGISA